MKPADALEFTATESIIATYIMQVAESIDIEDICEAGSKAKVLAEAGEHVPGVALIMVIVNPCRQII